MTKPGPAAARFFPGGLARGISSWYGAPRRPSPQTALKAAFRKPVLRRIFADLREAERDESLRAAVLRLSRR
jgi:hypothetical protein